MRKPEKFCGHRRRDLKDAQTLRVLDAMRGDASLPDQELFACQFGLFRFIVSDNDRFENDDRWRHVSMSLGGRLPNYCELKHARQVWFPAEAEVIQVFPPEKEFVNNHPFCLHLWWNKDRRLTPELMQLAVGIADSGEEE